VALVCGLLTGTTTGASAAGLTPPIWTTLPGTQPASGISCIGRSFCLAVGGGGSANAQVWNGTTWSVVPGPAISGRPSLASVSCTSATWCMAVGWSSTSIDLPLAEWWNGTTMTVTPIPSGDWNEGAELTGLACSSSEACEAVGVAHNEPTATSGVLQTLLIESWNGSQWTPVTGAAPSTSFLEAVSCPSADACMGVGGSIATSPEQPVTEWWDGRSWSIVNSPTFPGGGVLNGVTCTSATACTAVGSTPGHTLIETWNGFIWGIVPSPNILPPAGVAAEWLTAISCSGASACTAVGAVEVGIHPNLSTHWLSEFWNGSTWVLGPQNLGPQGGQLTGISCTAAVLCTAVGPEGIESTSGQAQTAPVVGIAANGPDGGYRLVGADGAVAAFGTSYFGSLGGSALNQPVVGMARTPDGQGYWLVAADGGVFSYGDARFYGSTGSLHLNQPVVGMESTPDGKGYWLVAADGGIFAYGDAQFHGSTGDIRLNQPVVGMAASPDGQGYWLVAADGGVFSYGDARFYGAWT
jgi:hypothetical protein